MNVKKLSLASLLLMTCSFGFAETFVKVTKMSQIIPGNRYVILYNGANYNNSDIAPLTASGESARNTSEYPLKIETSVNGSYTMSLIKTDINTTHKPTAFRLGTTDDGYSLESTQQSYSGYLKFQSNGQHKPELTTNPYTWTITANGDGTFKLSSDGHYLYAKGHNNERTPQYAGNETGDNLEIYAESQGGDNDMGETLITLRRSTSPDATDLNYYATTYYEQDFLLDEHVAAYGITNTFTEPIVGNVELTLTNELVAPTMPVFSSNPVLLVIPNDDPDAEETLTYPIFLHETSTVTEDTRLATNLVGTLEGVDEPDEYSYVLGRLDGEVVFGKVSGSIPAHRAYIQLAEGSEVKSLSFGFSKSTGIKEVSATEVNNGAIYNLIGQQVTKNYKGVVVKNGKKFLNK